MTISSGIGLISGVNYTALVQGLTAVDQSEINSIGSRINKLGNQDTALTSLSTLVTGLKISSASFISPAIFKATAATSANSSVINATGGAGTPTGNYSFTVQQLASASQVVTQGFSDSTTALGLSGTFTLQTGGGNLDTVANLRDLHGGSGVARGSIKITDSSGGASTINLSDAVSIQDVVTAINSSSGSANVSAKIDNDHLVITDNATGSGTFAISNTGGTTTATDLGLTTGTTSGHTLTSASLTGITASTTLNSLNDGNGIRTGNGVADFTVTAGSGSVNVIIPAASKTVGDLIKAINIQTTGNGVTASISSDGSGITLTSASGPVGVTVPTTLGVPNSLAAYDLGFTNGTAGATTLVGSRISNALSGPLLKNLNGGDQGDSSRVSPQAGTITVNGTTVDLSGATSLQDVIAGINNSSTGVTAALNQYGTGVTLTSSASNITVADGTGNLASYLHLTASTATTSGSQVDSGNLNRRYISNNTLLSSLNGGTGISPGSIKLTDGTGTSQTIDLSGKTITSINDVIKAINNSGLKLTASINKNGNGIQIHSTGGTSAPVIAEANGGTTAATLGIKGTFTADTSGGNFTLSGNFQKSITVAATDTLAQIATKINDAGVGVAASVINDGSDGTPYRLSISSRNAGSAGRLVFDGSGAGFAATSLVKGQDAVLVYGGNANGTGGLLTTSSSNTITGLVPALTLNLSGPGTTTVSVTNDNSKISTAVQSFVDSYNKVVTNIANVTNFDSSNSANNGILFGNSTVQQLQEALGQFVNRSYSSTIGGGLHGLAAVGITVGTDGTLTLDSDKLNTALSTDPTNVRNLFTKNVPAVKTDLTVTPSVFGSPAVEGIGATLSDLVTRFTDSSTGILFTATNALESQQTQLTTQQTLLNTLLQAKQTQLQATFANLESTLSSLQSQGNSISSISSTLSA